jgi:drug/metabolite transporter (DMT)-like permease
MLSTGAIGLSIVASPSLVQTNWMAIAPSYYGAAAFSGVFSVAGGAVMWAYGIHKLGPGRTANFNNLVPVLAIVLAFLFLHERLYVIQFVGAGVTIAGVWYARKMSAPLQAETDFPTTDPL